MEHFDEQLAAVGSHALGPRGEAGAEDGPFRRGKPPVRESLEEREHVAIRQDIEVVAAVFARRGLNFAGLKVKNRPQIYSLTADDYGARHTGKKLPVIVRKCRLFSQVGRRNTLTDGGESDPW